MAAETGLTPTSVAEGPISEAEFDQAMERLAPFEGSPHIVVGVSGGADSSALALLLSRWLAPRGGRFTALVVDHGLRTEAAAEARATQQRLAALGIPAEILSWTPTPPHGAGLQARAREARRRLLVERMDGLGAVHLALAHHAGDQRETVLHRLSRVSGLDGLGGMRSETILAEGRIVRPLLRFEPERLRATCRAAGVDWIEDPSNARTDFARGRMRRLQPALDALGLTSRAVIGVADKLADERAALDAVVADALGSVARFHGDGYVTLAPDGLHPWPTAVRARMLIRCLLAVGGRPYPPRSERLDRLMTVLLERSTAPRTINETLAGCRIQGTDDCILICREGKRIEDRQTLQPGESVLWDGRFEIALDVGAPGPLTVAPLSLADWRRLIDEGKVVGVSPPRPVREALPGLWRGDVAIGVARPGVAAEDVPRGSGRVSAVWAARAPRNGSGFGLVNPW